MADSKYAVASGFSLGGGKLGSVAVKSFSGLEITVEVSATSAGNTEGGQRKLEPRAGSAKPGTPTFVCAIPKGDKTLANWWKGFNPNAKQGEYKPADLTFTIVGDNGNTHAEWQLKGAFPMSYSVSDASSDSAELATETIKLCVTEIVREE